MLIFIVILIAILSVLMSFWSLRQELKKHKHEERVRKSLAKGKVIFYASSSRGSKSS